jgi:uncharacterized surface protein with fasciclin (FAS1) repeats
MTAWQLIQAEPTASRFAAAVQQHQLTAELEDLAHPLTVLVPTDQAIAANPDVNAILADPVAFAAFLDAHTIDGPRTVEQIFAAQQLQTRSGDVLTIDPVARTITGPTGQPATIVLADLPATNGYVDTISAVLAAPAPSTTTTVPG